MKKHNWISKISQSVVGKKNRKFRRRTRKQSLTIQSLEQRNLLASVSFDAGFFNGDAAANGLGLVTFVADDGQSDAVTVSSPSANTIQIQVGNGDAISLQGNATGNSNFVQTANDTVSINNVSSLIAGLRFELGDFNDSFVATSLSGLNFTPTGIDSLLGLSVDGFSGEDTIDVSALTIGANINGGFAADVLTGGSGNDFILGEEGEDQLVGNAGDCLLYTSPSPRDATLSRMPSSA